MGYGMSSAHSEDEWMNLRKRLEIRGFHFLFQDERLRAGRNPHAEAVFLAEGDGGFGFDGLAGLFC